MMIQPRRSSSSPPPPPEATPTQLVLKDEKNKEVPVKDWTPNYIQFTLLGCISCQFT
ncbi:hypothetical protein QJS10_CPB15g01402 [Acorus calamus]|uniref:Uncharacterized protein n=1 Tax=Acorus calamus TaxID=4465 RepID=A0AAV9D9T1_ACOCL|nr:hypothetical protein QJS10_CPB15g01402 [Acorus calamus]